MSLNYKAINWNRQKKRYDVFLWGMIFLYLSIYIAINIFYYPNNTIQTLIIRSFGSCAIVMLQILLIIGPLCRINSNFLPLLYNRRHFGVSMFFIALIHGIMNILQFHSLGKINPFVSVFTINSNYNSIADFPFQTLGFLALIILFLMAITSHDFWLNNLNPKIWKGLHMMVYLAYALIVLHVMLGTIQLEKSPILIGYLGIGMISTIGLHLCAGIKETKLKNIIQNAQNEDFIFACHQNEIEENFAKTFNLTAEKVAIYKYKNSYFAVSNICKHQLGPLGEGKIVDGCITCPWHGYQYLPQNGQSPPPFDEKIATYDLKIIDQKIYINPIANKEGEKSTVIQNQ